MTLAAASLLGFALCFILGGSDRAVEQIGEEGSIQDRGVALRGFSRVCS